MSEFMTQNSFKEAAYHSHELGVFVCGIVQPHAAIPIISFPEVEYVWLVVVLTALKCQHAVFAILHSLFGKVNNLQATVTLSRLQYLHCVFAGLLQRLQLSGLY